MKEMKMYERNEDSSNNTCLMVAAIFILLSAFHIALSSLGSNKELVESINVYAAQRESR